jgi:molybdopterin/thiamine biosynthesis adenylyltransferase
MARNNNLAFYAGQVPALGKRAQAQLAHARVLVVGAGRVGVNAVLGVHAAGVGRITIIDPQVMEPEQLGPYWFATEADLGQPKAQVLARFLSRRRLGDVYALQQPAESAEAERLFSQVDLAICCANTISARFAAERQSIAARIPVIQAAAFDGRERFGGMIHIRRPSLPERSCYGCLVDPQGKFARGEGLLSSVTAVIGNLAAHLAVMELGGERSRRPFHNNLLILNVEAAALESFAVERKAGCRICG